MMAESRLDPSRKEFPMMRLTMAGRFCGGREWKKLGRPLTDEELILLPEIPWDDEILTSPCPFFPEKAVSQTHGLFLSLPESIQSLTARFPNSFIRSDLEAWHLNGLEEFAAKASSLSWHLALLLPAPILAGKSREEQLNLLPDGYQPMSAVDETIKHLLYHSTFGQPLDESGYWQNCRDLTNDGLVVKVCTTERGISFGRYPKYPRPTTSMAVEIKP